jgi:Tfp pilus assembly protein PilV
MQIPRREKRASQAGLSMIELLVSMIIVTVIGTMLVAGWISLQRSFAFAQAKNTARATARDALERMSSELRDAQPPTDASTTPFYFALASPYVCDAYDCVFYSAYNNALARQDGTGTTQLRLTAIWLDTSGAQAQKTLKWTRDTNNNGSLLDPSDRTIILARNVVNTTVSPANPVFTYFFRGSTPGSYTTAISLDSTSAPTLVSVQIELVVDANLSHTPSYVDLKTTVQPRNAGAN